METTEMVLRFDRNQVELALLQDRPRNEHHQDRKQQPCGDV